MRGALGVLDEYFPGGLEVLPLQRFAGGRTALLDTLGTVLLVASNAAGFAELLLLEVERVAVVVVVLAFVVVEVGRLAAELLRVGGDELGLDDLVGGLGLPPFEGTAFLYQAGVEFGYGRKVA